MGIYSAKKGGGFTYKSGTSMASPHVTGVAALWAERQIQRTGMVNIATLEAQLRGKFDQHSVLADPRFVDPTNHDYHLKPDSPALKLGFKDIDTSRIGLNGAFPKRFERE